jgi:hypothetical protein
MNLQELKEKARAAGYTQICLDAEGARPVSLAQWQGVATGETWGTHQGLPAVLTRQVMYYLEGNKVLARRAGDKEFQYILT